MDLLKEGMKNISLYEVKKQVRKAQNVVLNFSEVEGKVREATNNEPWGTSSKKMQEIADATFTFRDREEICGLLFRRFTEKTASEWRQIYKSLILLEFLVKHGSERFVDDARNNSTLVARLKSFQYIDSKGVDQGRNIRNRAKLLMALLNDENKIRSERKKARENSKKFKGVSGGAPLPGMSTNPNFGYARDYDGDDNDDNMIYGDGGVYGQRFEQQRAAPPVASNSQSTFEEYDVRPGRPNRALRQKPTPPTPNPQENTPDLFSFDDDDKPAASATASSSTQNQQQASLFDLDDILSSDNNASNNNNGGDDDDDDFADFQSAVATPAVQQQQQNNTTSTTTSNYDLLGGLSMNNSNNNNNTFSSFSASTTTTTNNNILGGFGTSSVIEGTSSTTTTSASVSKPDAFSSLFSSAKMSSNNVKPKTTINGSAANNNNNLDDLFGDFNSKPAATPAPASAPTNNNTSSSNDLDLLSF